MRRPLSLIERCLRYGLATLIILMLSVVPLIGLLQGATAQNGALSCAYQPVCGNVVNLPLVPTETGDMMAGTTKPMFGVLQPQPQYMDQSRKAGVSLRTLELAWSRFEPQDGVWDAAYIAAQRQELAQMQAAGIGVMLDFGMQYPPNWIWNYPNSRYVNQYGESFQTTTIGGNGVNAIFNAAVRTAQARYVQRVFATLGTSFAGVRLGWGYYGELNYPDPVYGSHTNSYWAYDALAQGRTLGLPLGMRPAPQPGWTPGTPSARHAAAAAFANWYMDSLQNYHDWQIRIVRTFYPGRLLMLYPSWGIRPGQLDAAIAVDLNGTTSAEQNREVQRGFDWARFIAGITDPHVVVYTTWLDADDSADRGTDQRYWSPVHFLAVQAMRNPLHLAVWGENTGGGDMVAMQRSFKQLATYHLGALIWAFEPELYNGKHATINNYRSLMAQYK